MTTPIFLAPYAVIYRHANQFAAMVTEKNEREHALPKGTYTAILSYDGPEPCTLQWRKDASGSFVNIETIPAGDGPRKGKPVPLTTLEGGMIRVSAGDSRYNTTGGLASVLIIPELDETGAKQPI